MSSWPAPSPEQAGYSSLRASLRPTLQEDSELAQDHYPSSVKRSRQPPASQAFPGSFRGSRAQPKDRSEPLAAGEPVAAGPSGPASCRLSPSASSSQSKSSAVQTDPRLYETAARRASELGGLQLDRLSAFAGQLSNTSVPTEAYHKQQPGLTRPSDFKEELGVEDDSTLQEDACGARLLSSELATGHESPATVEELRIKNRSAQKRYRERQKGLKQQQAAERKRQKNAIEQLSQGNAALSARNKHLEHSLQLAMSELAIRPSAGPAQLLQQHLVRRNDQGQCEPVILEEGRSAMLNISGPYVLHREQLSNLSLKQYLALIKGLVTTMHRSLVSSTASPASEGGQLIEAAVSQFLFVGHNAYVSNMLVAREIHSINMDSCAPLKPISTEKWAGIFEVLKLSQDQKKQLAGARREYLQALGPILDKQQALLAMLEGPLRDWTLQRSPARLGQVWATNVELTKAINFEHDAYSQFNARIYCRVLTPMQIAVLAVRTWPVVPDLVSLGSIAETQLEGSCLSLEDTRLATGVSLPPSELSRRLDALSAWSGSGQQSSELSQPGNLRQISPMQQRLPAFSSALALPSQGPAQNAAADHVSQADWNQIDAQLSQLHRLPGRGFQSQAAILTPSSAPPRQHLPFSPPPSRGTQSLAARPVSAQQQPEASNLQGPGDALTTLGLLGQQVHHLRGMTGSGANNPASQSRLGQDGAGSHAAVAGLQQAELHRSRRPTVVVSNTLRADFPMDLLALPDQPSAPAGHLSQGFPHNDSAADAAPSNFADALRTELGQRAAPIGPALHNTALHGMSHPAPSAHDMPTAAPHSSLLTLPRMGASSTRAPMSRAGLQHFPEDISRADAEPLPSLAELCLPPRHSSSASAQDDDTMWVPELPVLTRSRASQEHPMDLPDLL